MDGFFAGVVGVFVNVFILIISIVILSYLIGVISRFFKYYNMGFRGRVLYGHVFKKYLTFISGGRKAKGGNSYSSDCDCSGDFNDD